MSFSKPSGKRKVEDEKRCFQERWELLYFFTESKDKVLCLICNQAVAVPKEYNVRRHFMSCHHEKYGALTGKVREHTVSQLKAELGKQQHLFQKAVRTSDETKEESPNQLSGTTDATREEKLSRLTNGKQTPEAVPEKNDRKNAKSESAEVLEENSSPMDTTPPLKGASSLKRPLENDKDKGLTKAIPEEPLPKTPTGRRPIKPPPNVPPDRKAPGQDPT
ncbi:hypothetical protein MTO96_028295 [Rhipicephalus appendiculatus]